MPVFKEVRIGERESEGNFPGATRNNSPSRTPKLTKLLMIVYLKGN